ncbi:hypothetical protein ACFX2J_000727 [Malus domestica]
MPQSSSTQLVLNMGILKKTKNQLINDQVCVPSCLCADCAILITLMRDELAGISSGGSDRDGSFFRVWLNTLSTDFGASALPLALAMAWLKMPLGLDTNAVARWSGVNYAWPASMARP